MGSGKSQKVGNRYYYGLVLIPCRKADAILAVKMADKILWEGDQGQGNIDINDLNAFGGDEREGGFSGRIAVALGGAAQAANAYLQGIFGDLTTAYRGVVSMIYQRPYINANSARLPAISTKQANVEDIHKGWLPDKAVVDVVGYLSTAAIYIAFDVSLSMGGAKIATQGAALAAFVRSLKGKLNSIHAVAYSAGINASFQRIDCTDEDYEDVAVWIEGYTTLITGGDWNAAVGQAGAFYTADDILKRNFNSNRLFDLVPDMGGLFGGGERQAKKRRIIIFTSDGAPVAGTPELAAATIAAIGGVEVFAFNIEDADTTETAKIDNTPRDGVPVVSGDDPGELTLALGNAFRSWVDMNPAHIQRCLLIDPMRGGTATADDIGDSFSEAADQYLAEGFGLSVIFSGADSNLADRLEIDRHCDAVTYRSRSTGKWEHKLIRDNFDFGDLPVLDGTVVEDWTKLRRPKARELPNKLTLVYTDRSNGSTASITKSNPVAVRAAGRTIKGDDARYPFCTSPRLANRLVVRDLTAGNTPLLGGEIPLAYLPAGLELASACVLRAPEEGIDDVPVRITELRHNAGYDGGVWLKVVEHRFELGADLDPGEPVVIGAPDDRAKPATLRRVDEAPYYMLVQSDGQSLTDADLAAEDGLGHLFACAAAPNTRHLDATVGIDAGGGYTEEAVIGFGPYAVTAADLSSEGDDGTIRVTLNPTLVNATEGQLALIGDEIIRIDGVAEDAGDILLTVGRACLDTAPRAHATGTTILFIADPQPSDSEFVDGEAVDVKLLPRTSTAILSLAAAPVDTVTFASRAIRPYPPGRFKLNGSYAQDQFTSNATLEWAHRDRTAQTTPVPEDHDDTSIGPEAGLAYRFVAEALDDAGAVISTVTDENLGTATTYDWDDATVLPTGTVRVRFSVTSVRDGYESWQRPEITMVVLLPPENLTATVY